MPKKQEKKIKFLDFYKTTIWVSRAIGSEIYLTNYNRNIFSHLLSMLISIENNISLFFVSRFFFESLPLGLAVLVGPLCGITFSALINVKWFTIWLQRKELRDLNKGLEEIFPQENLTKSELHIIRRNKKYVNFMCNLQAMYFTLNSSLNFFESIITSINIYFKTGSYPYIIPAEKNLNWSINSFGFYLMGLFFQLSAFFGIAYGLAATNGYFFVASMQLCMHYDLLAIRIQEGVDGFGKNDKIIKKDSLNFLRDIVIQQQKLIRFIELTNRIFSPSIFFNLLTCSLLICCLGVQIMLEPFPYLILYSPIIMNECSTMYMFCYCSNKLTEASENFAESVYGHNWIDQDITYKKEVLLMLQGSSKPAVIKVIGFANISLVTFRRVMRNTYRLLAVFNSAKNKVN